jgi:four helix bundle protein
MGIERFEDIEAWQLARELTKSVYDLTRKPEFSRDYGLRDQIQRASGSSMHNIAEGFDAESNSEFIRFLRYAKRSASEVQSELYMAVDQGYITQDEFRAAYKQAGRTRAAIRSFINYLVSFRAQSKNGQVCETPPEYGHPLDLSHASKPSSTLNPQPSTLNPEP